MTDNQEQAENQAQPKQNPVERTTIHEKTEKELPTIYWQKDKRKSFTEFESTIIRVSDTTSEAALQTYEKIRKMK
jgi:hypothetical protein